MRFATIFAAAALLLAACAQTGAGSPSPSAAAGGIEITVAQTSAGNALAGPDGKTLYVFTNDSAGTSTCTGGCADAWPALLGDGSDVVAGDGVSGTFGTTTRDDGSKQVTHNGQPLYNYAADQAAGDATGQGLLGKWFIAPVDEATVSPTSSGEQPSATPSGPTY
jgi:predicted lipoprotein with Yx(FWY)xxD motif